MKKPNDDLLAVSAQLNDLATALHARKDATNSFEEYEALNNELIEVNHRITMIGGLVFRQRSKAIADAVKRVSDKRDMVAKAVRDMEGVDDLLSTLSGFLGLVDDVLDLAKRVVI